MPPLTYRRPGLALRRAAGAADPLVKALQRDLRSLGYLRSGIEGRFGEGTERAVRALQYDLLNGARHGPDGDAPLALTTFNRRRVAAITGVLDEPLAACLEEILADPRVPRLPRSDDPARANRDTWSRVRELADLAVPRPFLLAVLLQESGGQHFHVPTDTDADDFIVVGLDRNDAGRPDHITSRGYGIGQYTLFHHPPRADEVDTLMLDPARNVGRAIRELDDKLRTFVDGSTPAAQADDRIEEFGHGPLRRCRYDAADPRYMADCVRCAGEHLMDIDDVTPLHPGTTETLHPTPYHPETAYERVPDRAKLGCDWPYAVRRYNGSGVNSYHYQYQVLRRLTRPPVSA
jgi:putative peptidoglycan binding protein